MKPKLITTAVAVLLVLLFVAANHGSMSNVRWFFFMEPVAVSTLVLAAVCLLLGILIGLLLPWALEFNKKARERMDEEKRMREYARVPEKSDAKSGDEEPEDGDKR